MIFATHNLKKKVTLSDALISAYPALEDDTHTSLHEGLSSAQENVLRMLYQIISTQLSQYNELTQSKIIEKKLCELKDRLLLKIREKKAQVDCDCFELDFFIVAQVFCARWGVHLSTISTATTQSDRAKHIFSSLLEPLIEQWDKEVNSSTQTAKQSFKSNLETRSEVKRFIQATKQYNYIYTQVFGDENIITQKEKEKRQQDQNSIHPSLTSNPVSIGSRIVHALKKGWRTLSSWFESFGDSWRIVKPKDPLYQTAIAEWETTLRIRTNIEHHARNIEQHQTNKPQQEQQAMLMTQHQKNQATLATLRELHNKTKEAQLSEITLPASRLYVDHVSQMQKTQPPQQPVRGCKKFCVNE